MDVSLGHPPDNLFARGAVSQGVLLGKPKLRKLSGKCNRVHFLSPLFHFLCWDGFICLFLALLPCPKVFGPTLNHGTLQLQVCRLEGAQG